MILSKNSKLVMIGDSITDAGRARPIGEGLNDALGHGYVSLINSLLGTVYHDLGVRIVNMGSSGNTVKDLKERWLNDVINLQPQWVSIMIGTNDVWRQFDSPLQTEKHVYPAEYERTLEELILTLPKLEGLILMTPFYIESNKLDPMRCEMDLYGAIVKTQATKHGAHFVDTQAAFDEVLQTYYPATLGWDRVHPNPTGHMVIARAFLNAIGFEW